jgi:integrase
MPAKKRYRLSANYVKKREKGSSSLVNAISRVDNSRDKMVLLLLAKTGITPKELVNLSPKDFDFSSGFLNIRKDITKSKRARRIELSSDVISVVLDNFSLDREYLLFTRKSSKADVRTVQRILNSFSKFYGEKVTSVDLRKFFISSSLEASSSDKVKFESGLKRLDKRKFLSEESVSRLKSFVGSERDNFIFDLLLEGVKSSKLSSLRVSDLDSLNVSDSLINKMRSFVSLKHLSRHDYVFLTRQNTLLTNQRIFQIIKEVGVLAGVEVSPRLLNNTALARALASENSEAELNNLGLKSRAFHLHGGFFEDG